MISISGGSTTGLAGMWHSRYVEGQQEWVTDDPLRNWDKTDLNWHQIACQLAIISGVPHAS